MKSTPLSVRGAASGGQVDAANLIKPLLSSGKIRVIGSTTYQEFSNIFEKDRALARRFQKIDITEPSVEETVQIINGLKRSTKRTMTCVIPLRRCVRRLSWR